MTERLLNLLPPFLIVLPQEYNSLKDDIDVDSNKYNLIIKKEQSEVYEISYVCFANHKELVSFTGALEVAIGLMYNWYKDNSYGHQK